MRGIEVRLKTEESHDVGRLPFVTLILLVAGVFGILFFLKGLNGVDFAVELVFPATGILCFVIWVCYARNRKLFYYLLAAAVFACVLTAVTQWNTLHGQLSHIKDGLSGEAELSTVSVTHLALLLSVGLPFLLFSAECLVKNHALPYILTTAFLLISPLLGIHATVETVFLFFLFQGSFWAVQIAARRGRNTPFAPVEFHRAGRIGIAVSLALILAFSVALPVASTFSERLFQSVYDAEGFAARSVSNLTGKASAPITGGKINTGNNYRTGAAHLTLTASRQPTEILYLRGFGGGEYTGGDWVRSSDEALFENIIERNDWREWYATIGNLYYSMYYIMNESMVTEEPPEPISLLIQHSNHEYGNAYVPYYSRRGWSYGGWLTGGPGTEAAEGYQYRYYEQKDMEIDWDNVSLDFEGQRDIYRQLQTEYIAEIREAYTHVPTELLPRLTALVEKKPLTDLNEITAFILYTLHSNAAYSLTPGWSAFNQDIVEYFLFERKEGFCEHFAVTATLMYRLYGVPARYATGYKIFPSEFNQQQENGSWRATATDEAAHAWVEIFLEDYGWTPVEVTPSSDGSSSASYPGFDGFQLDRIWEERGRDVSAPSLAGTGGTGLPNAGETGQPDFLIHIEMDWAKHQDLLMILLTCLCYTVLLMPLFLDHRRLRLLQKTEHMNCRELFYRLLELLHFCGILPEYDGSEKDFAQALSEAVPGILPADAERLITAVNEAAFGPSLPDTLETEFTRVLCHRVAAELYGGLSRSRKFVFKYIKAFG